MLLLLFANVTIIPVTSTDSWWDPAWSNRREIVVQENNGTDLTNYRVSLDIDTVSLISAGRMRSDCNDIRFTDAGGNPLEYWIESGCDSAHTKALVVVPKIGRNGMYSNPIRSGITWTDGKSGKGLFFDKTPTDGVQFPKYQKDTFAEGFTAELWVKPAPSEFVPHQNRFHLLTRGPYIWDHEWIIEEYDASLLTRINTTTEGGSYCEAYGAFSPQEWAHVIVTIGSGKVRMHRNGDLLKECPIDGTRLFKHHPIFSGTGFPIHGTLDGIRLYTRILSDDEIARRFDGHEVSREDLILQAELDEGEGQETLGISGGALVYMYYGSSDASDGSSVETGIIDQDIEQPTAIIGEEEGAPCDDGTMSGSCSPVKPKFCEGGAFSDRPSTCGCPDEVGDCNGDDSDGCEVDLRTDPDNCGGCGTVCPSGETCRDAQCETLFSFESSLGTGDAGPGNDQFNEPLGVFVGSDGKVYVSDNGNHRIQVFDESGDHYFTIGTPGVCGSSDTELCGPIGLFVDSSGNVYVADPNNHAVKIFDANGNHVETIGGQGTGEYEFDQPFGVFVDKTGKLYVADMMNHRVQVFNPALHYLGTIGAGEPGTDNDHFNRPVSVFVDTNGSIYVNDLYNSRVQVFDADRSYLGTIDTGQVGYGIFVDANGWLYGSRGLGNRVMVFDASREHVASIGTGSAGSGNDEFNIPNGIFVDSKGKIYVADRRNHRVQIFTGGAPTSITTPVLPTIDLKVDGAPCSSHHECGSGNCVDERCSPMMWEKRGLVVGPYLDERPPECGVSAPTVIREEGLYKMWAGGPCDQSFYHATSSDGITWSENKVSIQGARINMPAVLKHPDGTYKMWFGEWHDRRWRIYFSSSDDGQTWSAKTLVLDLGSLEPEGSLDSEAVEMPTVILDDDGKYKMWYMGIGHEPENDDFTYNILYATSEDGITWARQGIAIDGGHLKKTEELLPMCPAVVKDDDMYRMWYTGVQDKQYRIMYATSLDGVTWAKHGLALDIGNETVWDSRLTEPTVVKDAEGSYKMWYTGSNGTLTAILLAMHGQTPSAPVVSPSPTPSPTPSPQASATSSPSPLPTPSPQASATPSPVPEPSGGPVTSPGPTPESSVIPSTTPSASNGTSASAEATPRPTSTPSIPATEQTSPSPTSSVPATEEPSTPPQNATLRAKSVGEACTLKDECTTGNCFNGVCCSAGEDCCTSDDQCSPGQRCAVERFHCVNQEDEPVAKATPQPLEEMMRADMEAQLTEMKANLETLKKSAPGPELDSVESLITMANEKLSSGEIAEAYNLSMEAKSSLDAVKKDLKLAIGEICFEDSECEMGNCQNEVCCQAGERCCSQDIHCRGGEVCDMGQSHCIHIGEREGTSSGGDSTTNTGTLITVIGAIFAGAGFALFRFWSESKGK